MLSNFYLFYKNCHYHGLYGRDRLSCTVRAPSWNFKNIVGNHYFLPQIVGEKMNWLDAPTI